MTTTVTVEAHCGPKTEVVIVAVDDPTGASKLQVQAKLKDGEKFTAYATETRDIRVSEEPFTDRTS